MSDETDAMSEVARVLGEHQRFWSHVDASGDCWLWTASLRAGGYGSYWHEGHTVLAHRQAWTWVRGPLPDGVVLDHLCRNRACVRPDHMEPVTNAENIRRGATSFTLTGKCLAGLHDTDPGAIYVNPKHGSRACAECKRANLARRGACPDCGEGMLLTSVRRHQRNKHQDAQNGPQDSAEGVPGGDGGSGGADGAPAGTLSARLRALIPATYTDDGYFGVTALEIGEFADEAERAAEAHRADVENLGRANVRLVGQVERVQALAQWFRDQGQTGYARKVEEAVAGIEPTTENPFRMPEDRAPATDWAKVDHTADQCQFEECPSCGCCAHGKEHVIGCSTTLDRPLGTECPNPDCACKGGMG